MRFRHKENQMHQPIEANIVRQAAQAAESGAACPRGQRPAPEGAGHGPAKGKRGRPRVLSEADLEHICGLITVGCSRRTAARYVGCSPGTIINHMRRDEQLRRSGPQGRGPSPRRTAAEPPRAGQPLVAGGRLVPGTHGPQAVRTANRGSRAWQEVEKLFRSWTEVSLESVADPQVREQMKARAQELISGVKRCHRQY